ncbi:MAG: hypothetical protein J1E84_05200 [Muribaculaceae bacterium]|nr:hypothetical protein [Muribaculaceae bacterium]
MNVIKKIDELRRGKFTPPHQYLVDNEHTNGSVGRRVCKCSISIIVLLIVAVVIGIFSYYNVWLGDDIKYTFNFAHYSEEKLIQSFYDIIESQNKHYIVQNGRYFAHTLVQVFCGLWGQTAFAIANGLFYIFFFVITCILSNVKLQNYKGVVSVVLLGLLTFQTKMVPSHQISYIWTYSFTMLHLYIFFKNPVCSIWSALIGGILSIIVGNGQESLNIGISAALIVYWFRYRKSMSLLQYFMMIGFLIGTLIICLSPATYERGADSQSGLSIHKVFSTLLHLLMYFRSTYFLIVVVLYKKFHTKLSFSNMYKQSSFYWNTWIVLFIFNLLIGFGSNRAAFGVELMSLIIGMRLLSKQSLNNCWIIILTGIIAFTYVMQGENIIKKRNFFDEIALQYSQTADGRVYADMDYNDPVLFHQDFTHIIFPHGTEGAEDYYQAMLERHFRKTNPGKPPVCIIPSCLKGTEDKDLGNKVIKICDGFWLVIQSKQNPKEFNIVREISILSYHKALEPIMVDFPKHSILYECDNYRARIIREYSYNVFHLNTFDIKVSP